MCTCHQISGSHASIEEDSIPTKNTQLLPQLLPCVILTFPGINWDLCGNYEDEIECLLQPPGRQEVQAVHKVLSLKETTNCLGLAFKICSTPSLLSLVSTVVFCDTLQGRMENFVIYQLVKALMHRSLNSNRSLFLEPLIFTEKPLLLSGSTCNYRCMFGQSLLFQCGVEVFE